MKICPNCKAEVADDVMFCANCGTNLANVAPAEQQPANTPAFCPSCGTQLAPGTTFCPNCGAQLGKAPKAPAETPALIKDTTATLGTFIKSPDAAVGAAAKNKGFMWSIFGGLSILAFMFSLTTFIHELLNITFVRGAIAYYRKELDAPIDSDARREVREVYHGIVSDMHNWGLGLVWGLLIGAALFFGIGAMLYLAAKNIHKKDVKFNSVLNVVAVSSLPLTVALLLNMVITLVWPPLAIAFALCMGLLSLILMFNGYCKLADFEKRPTASFILAVGTVIVVVVLIVGIVVSPYMIFNKFAEISSSRYY